MTKKCLGCGIILQTKNETLPGYTPKIENKYCMRCFKITHYNELSTVILKKSNEEILASINNYNGFVFFLCDFLNIYEEVIKTYQKINRPKVFIITKSDTIPKNIVIEKLIKNIKDFYQIKEEIILCNTKSKSGYQKIEKLAQEKKQVILSGYTNVGKSSLINALTSENITVSNHSNTTLDFIKIKKELFTIIDAPGFVPKSFFDNLTPKESIKSRTYQLKNNHCLEFLGKMIAFDQDNNITLYLSNNININNRKLTTNNYKNIPILHNSDIIIKGLGFINSKKKCLLKTNIDKDLIEVRPTIIGGSHE